MKLHEAMIEKEIMMKECGRAWDRLFAQSIL
jgi:hypothetical protein